jgi:hypothetical protein
VLFNNPVDTFSQIVIGLTPGPEEPSLSGDLKIIKYDDRTSVELHDKVLITFIILVS